MSFKPAAGLSTGSSRSLKLTKKDLSCLILKAHSAFVFLCYLERWGFIYYSFLFRRRGQLKMFARLCASASLFVCAFVCVCVRSYQHDGGSVWFPRLRAGEPDAATHIVVTMVR